MNRTKKKILLHVMTFKHAESVKFLRVYTKINSYVHTRQLLPCFETTFFELKSLSFLIEKLLSLNKNSYFYKKTIVSRNRRVDMKQILAIVSREFLNTREKVVL